MFKKQLNIHMELPEKLKDQEALVKWYVKGINRKIFTAKFIDPVSASEAATRILETEMKANDKITLAKKIDVYGTHKNSKVHTFDPDIIAANAGYYSLKKNN